MARDLTSLEYMRDDKRQRNATDVYLEYGGGITTTIGPDSVGVPGGVALFGAGSKQFGTLPWKELFTPAIDIVRRGFPLPQASYDYLVFSGKPELPLYFQFYR